MKRPSSRISIRVANSATGTVANSATAMEPFAMVPDSVWKDAELGFAAVKVYACLTRSRKFKTACATIGIRRIAKLIGASTRTVQSALNELAERGHISATDGGKERKTYRLMSNRFRRSQFGESAGEVVEHYESGGVEHKRLVMTRPVVSQERKSA